MLEYVDSGSSLWRVMRGAPSWLAELRPGQALLYVRFIYRSKS